MDTMPTLAPATDPAARAFAQLAGKVDLLEAAIAGLAAKREAAPDYSETLGEIADLLEKIRNAINMLARRPAMTLTPDAMAEQIAAAAAKARAQDAATISQAIERLDKAAARIEYLEGKVADAQNQRRKRHIWGIGGTLTGVILCAVVPGFIAHAMPTSWHLPERIAARTVREPTLWEAGTRIMHADSPAAWQAIAEAAEMRRYNREAIDACVQQAAKAKQPVRCTIRVRRQP